MATKEMQVKVLHVSKTTAQWAAESTVISKGLLCIEFTTDGKTLAKVGDGASAYSALPYLQDGTFNIGDYYTKDETATQISTAISNLGNILTVKGVKAAASELPAEGNKVGDLWFVGAAGETTDSFSEYVWTEAGSWEFLGRVQTEVDLSGYAPLTRVEDVEGDVEALDGRIQTLEADTHKHDNASVLDATTAAFTTEQETKLTGIEEGANKTIVDDARSNSSTNPVQNKVIDAALAALEADTHKHDNADVLNATTASFTTEQETKLYSVEEGANKTIVDEALSDSSTNPVQNQAVNAAVSGLDSRVQTLEADTHKHDNASVLNATTAAFTTEQETKLTGIEEGANKTIVDEALSDSSTNPVQNKTVNAAVAGLDSRVADIEADYIKSTDTLVLNCTL